MTNQYPSKCCVCGNRIESDDGECSRIKASEEHKWPVWGSSNKWVIRHSNCAAPDAETDLYDIKNMPDYEGVKARILAAKEKLRKDNKRYF